MHSREKKQTNSFSKGLILLSLLIVVFLFYSRITTKGLPPRISSIVNSEFESFRNLKEFSDEQKLSYKKSAAGFWIYQTEDSTAPFQKLDRIELLDNGIIWQVTDWFVEFPSGDTVSFMLVRHAYLDPYASVRILDLPIPAITERSARFSLSMEILASGPARLMRCGRRRESKKNWYLTDESMSLTKAK